MEWMHKNVKITMDDADFAAKVGTVSISAPSLTSVKKKIDAALTNKFVTFRAIEESLDGEIVSLNVIDCRKAGNNDRISRGSMMFVTDTKDARDAQQSSIYPDTPKNRAAMKKYIKLRDDGENQKKAINVAISKAKDEIEFIAARNFSPDMVKP